MKEYSIYLSAPNVDDHEKKLLASVMDSGWVAPTGPQLNDFENGLKKLMGDREVLCLNSGTSALHLSLILSGVGAGDTVIVGTFTFAACANVVMYQGATPVFIDSESITWNLDPELLRSYLLSVQKKPKAVIVTHLYGTPAAMNEISKICKDYEIVLIEDAAEALGSLYNERPVGSIGDFGILSFNGNKIITTSSGGALVTNQEGYKRGLHLTTQANDGAFGYDHSEVGFNYSMSNVLAGVGVAQLEKLDEFVKRKREIFSYYKAHLPNEIFTFDPEPINTFCNRWLSTPRLDEGVNSLDLIKFLDKQKIQCRQLWKPLHLHKAYSAFEYVGGTVAEEIYMSGMCLPSGTGLQEDELELVVSKILDYFS